jgi:hypothetical protein
MKPSLYFTDPTNFNFIIHLPSLICIAKTIITFLYTNPPKFSNPSRSTVLKSILISLSIVLDLRIILLSKGKLSMEAFTGGPFTKQTRVILSNKIANCLFFIKYQRNQTTDMLLNTILMVRISKI